MRKLQLLLSILLLTAIVTSCTSEAPKLLSFLKNYDNSYADFGGREVVIGIAAIGEEHAVLPLDEDISARADSQRNLIKAVEDKLRCKIVQKVADQETVAATIMSLNCKYDLLFGSTEKQIDLIKSGLLYDLTTFENIDLSNEAKWGTAQEQLHRTYQGKVFGVKPRSAESAYTSLEGVLMSNDSLIKTFGQPTPKELLEQGNWTFDYFLDYIVNVSDINADTPIYGMTHYSGQLHQLPLTAIFSNGGSLLQDNGSGKLSFDLTSDPKAVKALEWAKDVYATGVVAEDEGNTNADIFISGKSSLWLGGAWVGTSNRDGFPLNEMNSGYSFIGMPYGPDGVYGETYSSFIFVSRSLAVPITSDEYEMGSFLNEFCSEFSQEELELLQEEARFEYFFNEEDYDLLIDMAENAVYTYLYAELTDVKNDIFDALQDITEGKSSISESIGAIESKVSQELEKIK